MWKGSFKIVQIELLASQQHTIYSIECHYVIRKLCSAVAMEPIPSQAENCVECHKSEFLPHIGLERL